MAIVILYESDEWSNIYLRESLLSKGYNVKFYNFETENLEAEQLNNASLVVNRLFPSAYFRGHMKTYELAGHFMNRLHNMNVPMINSYEAFVYDFDKMLVCRKLAARGIKVPQIYCSLSQLDLSAIRYPCIVKPNQGGRSMDTFVVKTERDLKELINDLPPVEFIIQEFIKSVDDQTIRVEVIGDRIICAFKRTIDSEGISSFSRGSQYTHICPDDQAIRDICLPAMKLLTMKMASFDLIAGEDGLYVIDVNATSNFASSDIALNGFNPLDLMVDLIISEYSRITNAQTDAQAIRYLHSPSQPRG